MCLFLNAAVCPFRPCHNQTSTKPRFSKHHAPNRDSKALDKQINKRVWDRHLGLRLGLLYGPAGRDQAPARTASLPVLVAPGGCVSPAAPPLEADPSHPRGSTALVNGAALQL